ncbi:hypothetical protein FM106_26390 [Brachybacterium faecium]|nr:hypothetical protein FM106_26390 [Brachybacterium faecium]
MRDAAAPRGGGSRRRIHPARGETWEPSRGYTNRGSVPPRG